MAINMETPFLYESTADSTTGDESSISQVDQTVMPSRHLISRCHGAQNPADQAAVLRNQQFNTQCPTFSQADYANDESIGYVLKYSSSPP